jgi:hypothetical protein
MRQIFAAHLNRNVVIGGCKLTYSHPKGVLFLSDVRAKTALATPGSVAWNNAAAMQVITNIEGNANYGDCVEAEEAHFIGLVTANAKGLFTYTQDMTLAMYSALTSPPFNPATGANDNGTDPIQCLGYFLTNPYADGTKNAAYLIVDATNQNDIRYALATFGNLKLWLALPDSYVNPIPSANGFVWDVDTPDPNQGHCIGGCGYLTAGASVPQSVQILGVTALGIVIMTWGLVGTLTWAAAAQLCVPAAGGGIATRVTTDWLNANGQSPTGLALTQLLADLANLGTPVTPSC